MAPNGKTGTKRLSPTAEVEQVDVLMFKHKCFLCGRRWDSEKKADTCPACGQWHISLSSFLK